MADREKVIKGLEYCIKQATTTENCTDTKACPYYESTARLTCWIDLNLDALELLKAQEWISVKERLPEQAGKYLIAALEQGKYTHITTVYFGRHFTMTGRMAYWKVTHWMPIPEPPKEET